MINFSAGDKVCVNRDGKPVTGMIRTMYAETGTAIVTLDDGEVVKVSTDKLSEVQDVKSEDKEREITLTKDTLSEILAKGVSHFVFDTDPPIPANLIPLLMVFGAKIMKIAFEDEE